MKLYSLSYVIAASFHGCTDRNDASAQMFTVMCPMTVSFVGAGTQIMQKTGCISTTTEEAVSHVLCHDSKL